MLLCSRYLSRLSRMEQRQMRSKNKRGSIVQDKRDKVWRFFWWENGKRRSKALGRFPTKTAAWSAAQPLRATIGTTQPSAVTVNNLIARFRVERMPTRSDTKRSYEVWLRGYIIPTWGERQITDVDPRSVELWLAGLALSPRSKAHIRGTLSRLFDFAAWSGDVPREQRNPMSLVRVKNAASRVRQIRTLTVAEFQQFSACLPEPYKTMARLCCCLGLRISECLALKWSDVDWLNGKLLISRAIVNGQIDGVKTTESKKWLVAAPELLATLQTWKQTSRFSEPGDWMFASPVRIGRLPLSYEQVKRMYHRAARAAGIGIIGTHSLRHTYRTWLDSTGTPVGVQQRLMRHANVSTTMNHYGTALMSDMAEAHGRVVALALTNGTGNGTEVKPPAAKPS